MNSQNHKPNSDRRQEDTVTAERPPHPLDNVLSPAPDNDALPEMQSGLFELGRNRSRLSGTTKPVPEDLRSLEDHARSIARDTYRDQFDPQKNAHDRMLQAEYERH